MGKIKRGGYVFVTWVSDHPPRHAHVYHDGRFVVKWDLQNWMAMKGQTSGRLLRILRELVSEGLL